MAKLDFPVATADGQEFVADTGVIYTYIGAPPNGHWTGVSMPDSGFVQVIGDTMTGQLTLPGGGSDTQALQKQEIDALIDASQVYTYTGGVEQTLQVRLEQYVSVKDFGHQMEV